MQITLDDPRVEMGLGEEKLRDRFEDWAAEGREIYFSNISRNTKKRDCDVDYWYTYVNGGRGAVHKDAEVSAPLVIGTALHDAAEHILKCLFPPADAAVWHAHDALELQAQTVAQQSLDDAMRMPRDLPLDLHTEYQNFQMYMPDLIEVGSPLLRTFENCLATEEIVWALVPITDIYWVCLIGRFDALVMDEGALWHLQHKTRGRESGYAEYVQQLSYSAHETGYGAILRRLIMRGDFGMQYADIPYMGSKVMMWLKQERPVSVPIVMPKGLMEHLEKGHVAVHPRGQHLMTRAKCTDKQWASAQSLHKNWVEREAKRKEGIRSYTQRAVQILDVDLDEAKMDLGLQRTILSIWQQWGLEALDPVTELIGNTSACTRYNRMCIWAESEACGGWDDHDVADDESPWIHRTADYIDGFRAEYLEAISEAK